MRALQFFGVLCAVLCASCAEPVLGGHGHGHGHSKSHSKSHHDNGHKTHSHSDNGHKTHSHHDNGHKTHSHSDNGHHGWEPSVGPSMSLADVQNALAAAGLNADGRVMGDVARCILDQTPEMAAVSTFRLFQTHLGRRDIQALAEEAAGDANVTVSQTLDTSFVADTYGAAHVYGAQEMPPITGFDAWNPLSPSPNLGSEQNCRAAGGTYCYATAGKGRSMTALTSACVPAGCSSAALRNVMKMVTQKFHRSPAVHCMDEMARFEDDEPAQRWAAFLIGLACLVVAMTALCRLGEGFLSLTRKGEDVGEAATLLADDNQPVKATRSPAVRRLLGVFLVWDIAGALDKLLAISPASRGTNFLNGMRVLSMAWVILAHVVVFAPGIMPGLDNSKVGLEALLDSYRSVLIPSGVFAVDTFFYMSGFLACYMFLHPRTRSAFANKFSPLNTLQNLALTWVGRYARLTPLFAAILYSTYYLLQYMIDSPYSASFEHGGMFGGESCTKYAYLNLLYVQNLMPHREMKQCFYHSWYLAVDMQFLILGSLVMVGYIYAPRAALGVTAALAVGSLAAVVRMTDDAKHIMAHDMYTMPWSRCAPYLYGMAAGYAMRVHTERVARVVRRGAVRAVMYVLAAGLLMGNVTLGWAAYRMGLNYEAYGWTLAQARAYQFFYHFGWGLGLTLLTFCWASGHGGMVKRFLASPMWEPIGRLTFGMYLVHPMVMAIIVAGVNHGAPAHFSDTFLLVVWLATVMGSMLGAFVCFVFIEHPAGMLYAWLLELYLAARAGCRRPAAPATADNDRPGAESAAMP